MFLLWKIWVQWSCHMRRLVYCIMLCQSKKNQMTIHTASVRGSFFNNDMLPSKKWPGLAFLGILKKKMNYLLHLPKKWLCLLIQKLKKRKEMIAYLSEGRGATNSGCKTPFPRLRLVHFLPLKAFCQLLYALRGMVDGSFCLICTTKSFSFSSFSFLSCRTCSIKV